MTEYEIADLAVSTQGLFWQQVQALQGSFQNVLTIVERFMTVLFGYLIVAYFIGAKLTRVQAGIMTALYLFWRVRLGIMVNFLGSNGSIIVGEMKKISPIFITLDNASLLPLLFLLSILTLASRHFMWSVRHPTTG